MYKKKDHTPLIITIIAVAAVLLLVAGLTIAKNKGLFDKKEEPETVPRHEILIYKSSGGSVRIEGGSNVREYDTQVKLDAAEDEMITLLVTPVEGRTFKDLKINDADNITREESYLVNDANGESKRINFVMPHCDIILNFTFADEDMPETEKETETQTDKEAGSPYGLKLHGVTAEVIASYNGKFDDASFLTQLGDDLNIGSVMSEYHMVTDVTFSKEAYDGKAESDKVFHYIYFNHDPEWKMLSAYYKRENRYIFMIVKEEDSSEEGSERDEHETEKPEQKNQNEGGQTASSAGTVPSAGSVPSDGSSSGMKPGKTTYTEFDIMEVSKTFLKYVGGQDAFYEQTFQYVLLKGLTGHIVGTMSSYEILPDENRATFSITLSSGGTIRGSYDRSSNTFRFKGL